MANYAALKTEIDTDPESRGYAGMSDQQAADSLNAKDRPANRASMSGDEIFQQTNPTEYVAVSDHKRNLWTAFTSKDSVDPFATNNVEFVKWIFGDASQTVTNLADARTTLISRAEEIGFDKKVTARDVERVRSGT